MFSAPPVTASLSSLCAPIPEKADASQDSCLQSLQSWRSFHSPTIWIPIISSSLIHPKMENKLVYLVLGVRYINDQEEGWENKQSMNNEMK